MMNYFGTICLFALFILLIKANEEVKPLECYVGIYDGIYNAADNVIPDLDLISNWTEKKNLPESQCLLRPNYHWYVHILYVVQLLIVTKNEVGFLTISMYILRFDRAGSVF